MNKNIAFFKSDIKNIYRESLLVLIPFIAVIMLVAVRLITPPISNLLMERFSFDLSPYYPLITVFMLLMTPLFFGMIFGFLLLDERDEHIIEFLSVTPLSKSGYLVYRIATPFITSFLVAVFAPYICGLTNDSIFFIIPLAFISALNAPLLTMVLACFASNKVEGLAVTKFASLSGFIPFAPFFITSRWQYLFGIFPHFWAAKAYLASNIALYWIYIFVSLLLYIAYLLLLIKIFVDKKE